MDRVLYSATPYVTQDLAFCRFTHKGVLFTCSCLEQLRKGNMESSSSNQGWKRLYRTLYLRVAIFNHVLSDNRLWKLRGLSNLGLNHHTDSLFNYNRHLLQQVRKWQRKLHPLSYLHIVGLYIWFLRFHAHRRGRKSNSTGNWGPVETKTALFCS